ncbi:hypothetical protein [Bacteriovorax sp. Seq25_V]|uniref:hypothetical protein n=1 Tax=Bacteriovorax sp. Seq25_V TaxID=1201288 RepID=UPI00038A2ACB|nr:hypothetical protein [Bacteriovorax sp. Seq25_V]EQC44031.1 hypothetical protein M900_1324 [Bacteriovorax sp. Seq25_V]
MRHPELLDINKNAVQYGRWLLPKDFKLHKEVLIAFSEKNGHMYLIAGQYEMHGHFIYMRTFKKLFTPRSPQPIVYIRFKNLSNKSIEKIERYIESNEGVRHSSCINYVLITLFTSLGIVINHDKRSLILKLRDCLDGCLFGDVKIHSQSTEVEVFKTKDWSMYEIYTHFDKIEKRFLNLLMLSRVLEKMSIGIWRKDIRNFYKLYFTNSIQYIQTILHRYI